MRILCADISEHLPVPHKIQMPGNHPKEKIQQIKDVCFHEAMPKKARSNTSLSDTYFATLLR